MAECIFCGHKFKGDMCDLCGTGYTWHQLLNAKERKEQQVLADAGDVKASLRIGQYLHNQQDYQGCMPYLWTAANAGEGEAQSLGRLKKYPITASRMLIFHSFRVPFLEKIVWINIFLSIFI